MQKLSYFRENWKRFKLRNAKLSYIRENNPVIIFTGEKTEAMFFGTNERLKTASEIDVFCKSIKLNVPSIECFWQTVNLFTYLFQIAWT